MVIDDEIYDAVLKKFAELGAHICNEKETELLERTVIDPETGFMQPMAVGQKATDIARFVGLSVKPDTKLLIAPIQGVGREHPLSVEKLFPVLAVYRAKSVDEALKVCVDVNHAGGLGHTAVIFSRNDEVIRKFSEVINAGRIIVNSPGSIGALGGGLQRPGAHLLVRMRHRRRQQHHRQRQHLSLPEHQARGAEDTSPYVVPSSQSDLLQHERGGEPAPVPVALHHHRHQSGAGADRPRGHRPALHSAARLTFMSRSFPTRSLRSRSIMQGVEALNFYKADQIIALGGGSVIDAAKIMKLKYESPEADLEELAAPFLDIPQARGRSIRRRKINRARLIAISTTSGTGSEVTPFAVLTDKERGRKVTLADYSLTPDVAIVDPQFVMSMPKGLTADTGIDCLTHALEAGVSIYASPYTDSNAMQAIRLVFKYLPIAYEHPHDEEARSMMHNAACIAAMAFSNASVGVNHALAHAFGARFGVAHGRANALMLPHVIAYNAAVPTKFMPSPYTKGYVAHKKYATMADLLGLGGHTVEEKVKNLVAATEQLLDQLEFPRSIAELGISQEEFERAMPELAKHCLRRSVVAVEPSHAADGELVELFWKAYRGPRSGEVGWYCSSPQRCSGRVVHMAMIAVFLKIDEERVVPALQEAGEKLDGTEGEAVLDFSSVRRIDTSGATSDARSSSDWPTTKAVKVVLRGVNVDVYKVLKLVKLTPRFSFVN